LPPVHGQSVTVADQTGITLPPGSVVTVVRFSRVAPTSQGLQSVYAMVRPATGR
jgi:hypothetical protein